MPEAHDEYSGIFDHLSPDDFSLETSAFHTETGGPNAGAEAFDAFVDARLNTVRTAFAASDGVFHPTAWLANATTVRTFVPDDDETLGQYVDRLAREARLLGAQWFCITQVTQVGSYAGSEAGAVDDPKTMAQAKEAGKVETGLLFYAERREGRETQRRRVGYLRISGTRLTDLVEGTGNQGLTLYDQVLAAVHESR